MNLTHRPRRLRKSNAVLDLVAETHLRADDFITPLFVVEGAGKTEAIPSMPDYYRHSLDTLLQRIEKLMNKGLFNFVLFAKIGDGQKDNTGENACDPDGLFPFAIRKIKAEFPEATLFTDIALDPYSTYGHDGIVRDGKIVNDETVEALCRMSLAHAEAGADFVAPSDMMDGRVGAIRQALDRQGFTDTGILAYSAKYASCFYGPFRDALDSAPGFGDKRSYQMDIRNSREAVRETLLDVAEGADMVMVKPAGAYLDVISKLKAEVHVPVAAYQVSGEYSMIKAAAERGWLNEDKAIIETLTAIKRAGADVILTYFAEKAVDIIRH
ncbi:MAG: porphobilinogen synthase [Saprospiraceae bacterium]|jgi:porphobilinogen synthase|nr:porphobilinogen synthase [Saprospiraceae bacterium]